MSSSNPDSESSSEQLTFPPVRVDQSIERLDLHTLIMRSNARRNNAEEATPLDESSYEVLGDSVYETSDDEAHTASVASTTPDDVSILTDDEEDADDDFEREFLDGSPQPLEASITEAPDVDMVSGGDESTLTEAQYMTSSESNREVIHVLDEERIEGQHVREGWTVTKEYTEAQAGEGILKPYDCCDLRLTVRAPLSDVRLPPRKSFKILYVGMLGHWAKAKLDKCIGVALNASPGPSRSIMRDGQLETYGIEISSDHCLDIQTVSTSATDSEVVVELDDGTHFTFGAQREYSRIESSRVPDLVIFWYPHPRLRAIEVDNFPTACKAFEQQGIMCLHVAEDRRFHCHSKKKTAISPKSLRVCVEGKKSESGEFERQEDIPIDLWTLLNLDPSQLNRHLAALGPRAVPSKSKRDSIGRTNGAKKGGFEFLSEPSAFQFFALAVGALSMIVALYLIPSFSGMASPSQARLPMSESLKTSVSIVPPTTITSAAPVSSASSESIKVTPRELTVVSPQNDFAAYRWSRREEKPVTFEIQTPSAHQFVLSPTKNFTNRKSKPQLQIQVSKGAENIPIRYTRTMNGTYIVDLENKYPFGRFNVSIATHSKPLMQQSFSIDMGQNRTLIAQLIDVAKDDIAVMRQGMVELRDSIVEGISKGLHREEFDNSEFKKRIDELVKRQAGAFQSVTAETWMGLRKRTAPIRTSTAALRARDNAFQVRCRFEEALGLSSKEKDGKKSRSCKHIGR